jgi:predicted nucleic acid-binding protein
VTDVVLDSGPLTMWADADRRVLAILEAVQRDGGVAFVPTVCLVESLTGGPKDANLNRRLKGARVVSLDESDARSAASRRAVIEGSDAADPVVVAIAARLRAAVVTTDPRDMAPLADAGPPTVAVVDARA